MCMLVIEMIAICLIILATLLAAKEIYRKKTVHRLIPLYPYQKKRVIY